MNEFTKFLILASILLTFTIAACREKQSNFSTLETNTPKYKQQVYYGDTWNEGYYKTNIRPEKADGYLILVIDDGRRVKLREEYITRIVEYKIKY